MTLELNEQSGTYLHGSEIIVRPIENRAFRSFGFYAMKALESTPIRDFKRPETFVELRKTITRLIRLEKENTWQKKKYSIVFTDDPGGHYTNSKLYDVVYVSGRVHYKGSNRYKFMILLMKEESKESK